MTAAELAKKVLEALEKERAKIDASIAGARKACDEGLISRSERDNVVQNGYAERGGLWKASEFVAAELAKAVS